MRRLLFVVLILSLLGPARVLANSLSIDPTSGPPGTVVTLNVSTAEPVRECYVNGTFIGDGSTPYTVPGGAQGTLTFRCDVGLGGEFMVPTNEAVFTVTAPPPPPPPPPPESPASLTISINPTTGTPPVNVVLSAQASDNVQITQCTANGVPFNPPNYVVPEGTTGNTVFRCEGMSVTGAPVTSNDAIFSVTDAPQPPPPTAPPAQPTAIPLPALPADGTCYVATIGGDEVNIRAAPNTSSDLVGALNPRQVYVADAQSFQPDGVWYRLQIGGYVAGFVTRQSAACADVPLEGLEIVDDDDEGGMVRLAVFSYDFEALFADCPELLVYLDSIPLHILNSWADFFDTFGDDPHMDQTPCDFMWEYIESMIFGDFSSVIRLIPPEVFDQLVRDCPGKAVAWLEVLYTAWMTDDDVFAAVLRRLPADICAATDTFMETIRGFVDDDYRAWLFEISLPIMVSRYCGVSVSQATLRNFGVLSLFDYPTLINESSLLCDYIGMMRFIGTIDDAERAFYRRLMETCDGNPYVLDTPTIATQFFYIIRSRGINVNNVRLDADDPTLCTDPWGYLYGFAPDPMVDGRSPDVPPQLASCPEDARLLRAQNDTVTPYALLAILNAADPCAAAARYINTGVHPGYTGPPLTCDPEYTGVTVRVREGDRREPRRERDPLTCAAATFIPLPQLINNCVRGTPQRDVNGNRVGGTSIRVRSTADYVEVVDADEAGRVTGSRTNRPDMTLVLADGSVLDTRSSWSEKVAALNRPPEAICEQTPPRFASPPADAARICYGVSFALRDDNNLSGTSFGPTVGIAVMTAFSDGRPAVLETNYQSVSVRRGGVADLSFVAYVTNRYSDPAANYNVDISGLTDLSLVTSTGVRHGQVDDALCRENVSPRSGDFFLTFESSVSVSLAPVVILPPAPDAEEEEEDPDRVFELDPEPGEVEFGDGEPGRLPPPPPAPAIPGLSPGSAPAGEGGLPDGVTPASIDDFPAPDVALPTTPRTGRTPVFAAPVGDAPDAGLSDALLRLNPLFNGRIDGTSAVFVGERDGRRNIYVLQDDEVTPLFDDDMIRGYPAFNDTGGLIAFIESAPDGAGALVVHNRYSGVSQTIFSDRDDLRLLPYRPAWMPDARDVLLFISLQSADGAAGIYLLDLSLDAPAPELFVSDARQPVMARDGLFMAYVRDIDGVSNIITRGLRSNREQAITDQINGIDCHSPTFSNLPTTMYFVCGATDEEMLYRYNLSGLEAVDLQGAVVRQPAAGPVDGFISYDDGQRIHLTAFDGSLSAPLIEIDGIAVSGIHWSITP
ncbi:MAG: hypothetical protein EA396_11320 [Anaerolineaceae bacterium]|nr:MAG: hypothetical protein EA396_11320 [Anaerolineaceae bacterium]